MTFYILLSTVAILTTIVGCALIWGYDMVRAREIERGFAPAARPDVPGAAVPGAEPRTELGPPARD